ncbi:MAG: tetratricopeptide repeat protein [Saprospiraceae bacterium]
MNKILSFAVFTISIVIFTACQSKTKAPKVDEAALNAKITLYEAKIRDTTIAPNLNRSAYPELAQAYLNHVEAFPKQEEAAKKLYDAGGLFMSVGDAEKAIAAWQKVLDDYSSSKWSKNALIEQAFINENILQDLEKAKALYEQFIKKYPNDELTDDAQFSLQNLGKSPDEVLKSLQK